MRTFFQRKSVTTRLVVVLGATIALALSLAPNDGSAAPKGSKREGGLRKSTEERRAQEPTPSAGPQSPSVAPAPKTAPTAQTPAESAPQPAQASPAEPVNPKPKPEPPKPQTPPPPPKSPLEKAQEELETARRSFERDKFLDSYRQTSALTTKIKTQFLDRVGTDWKGQDSESFRQIFEEAVKLAEESGNRLNGAALGSDKTLTFYF